MITSRDLGPDSNRVLGLDGRWRLDDTWSVRGQWAASRTRGAGASDRDGTLLAASISRDGRAFRYESSYRQLSPDFDAQLGYIRRVDLRETEHEVGYSWYPQETRVLRASASLEGGALWSYAGQLQDWTVEPGVEIELAGNTELDLRHWAQQERFAGKDFRRHSTMLAASSEWWSWLAVQGEYRWGTGITYYPAPGLEPFLADLTEVESGVTLRLGTRLRIDERYLFSRFSAGGDRGLTGDVFNNHIVRSRASYQFTRELTGRVILDYEAVLPNQRLVSLEREKRLGIDLLATYLVNPWTAVYVGYTDGYENLVPAGPAMPPLRRGGPTTSTGRQVFVKVGYLLRY
jgi:hypothetical protein